MFSVAVGRATRGGGCVVVGGGFGRKKRGIGVEAVVEKNEGFSGSRDNSNGVARLEG